MKVLYEFNLPDDEQDLEVYQKAVQLNSDMWEIHQICRNNLKYGAITAEEAINQIIEIVGDHV